MAPRRGRLVRPLLGVDARARRAPTARRPGLAWREDESNPDRALARNRLRLDVLPGAAGDPPGGRRGTCSRPPRSCATRREVLEQAVDEALQRSRRGRQPAGGRGGAAGASCRRRCGGWCCGGWRRRPPAAPLPLGPRARARDRAARRSAAAAASLDLGGGRAGGRRVRRASASGATGRPRPRCPPRCRCRAGAVSATGRWSASSSRGRRAASSARSTSRCSTPDRLARTLTVRGWRDGDRMRPLGLDGTKSLQDLFSDRKVPRSLRRSLPVVESDGEIAWVAGVAVSERFKVDDRTPRRRLRLRAALRRPRVAVRLRRSRLAACEAVSTPRVGETIVEAERAPAPRGASSAREIIARLRGPRALHDGRAEGRRVLPRRPDAADRPAVRARLHGGVELRLADRLLRRGADPEGPRRPDRGQGRADRRGHRRLRADAQLSAAQPARRATRARSRSARCW